MDPPWSPTPLPRSTLYAPIPTQELRHQRSYCGFLPLCLWCFCCCGLFRSCPPLFDRPAHPTLV
ncbi:hypothetical protein C5167_000363 [Papaver somniferum]|uniref:Uncharacterized protein n=1 Tax=Papaver somniferum TaxID=3469 RepID=A0A4Y7KSH3_PAPSO|nr:hypothetical protein C5167_000363 [Papaver somniferum]